MLLKDIAARLMAAGIGIRGVDIFLGYEPDTPDNIIVLFEYGGSPSPLEWDGEEPGLNVRVRNNDYDSGRAKIESIRSVLHGLHDEVLGTTRYILISEKQAPESLGRETSAPHRWLWVINFSIIKEK